MNKRDFLKGTAALSLTPAILPNLGNAAAAVATPVAKAAAAIPTPSYVYDSTRRIMRFYRGDPTTQDMFAYFARS